MDKIILIYANCVNDTAKGDFAFAGAMAADITQELEKEGSDFEAVLTSTNSDMWRYTALYGQPEGGKVSIHGVKISVQPLEKFDAINNEVVAFIEANRCKYAATELVKRVVQPKTKFLHVGAANKSALPYNQFLMFINKQQSGIFPYFSDSYRFTAGLGADKNGMTNLKKTRQLPTLVSAEASKIPTGNYGFIYFAAIDPRNDSESIAQFMTLGKQDKYVLVGNFQSYQWLVEAEIRKAFPSDMPMVTFYPSLDNLTMRHMVNDSGLLVGSTGVMSALEAMHDGKLTYYQNFPTNHRFVESYLTAVKSKLTTKSFFGQTPQLITQLAELLFMQKPLSNGASKQLQNLLEMSSITDHMKVINHEIIDEANGKIGRELVKALLTPSTNSIDQQVNHAKSLLRKQGEYFPPEIAQALRRAASWKLVFELRTLLEVATLPEINESDSNLQRTSLHWAVLGGNPDCVTLLLKAKAEVNAQDKQGKTPLDHAGNSQPLIEILKQFGAKTSRELEQEKQGTIGSKGGEDLEEGISKTTKPPTPKSPPVDPSPHGNLDTCKVASDSLIAKIEDYLRWSKDKNSDDGRNYILGFFSKWRHGEFGMKRAEELKHNLLKVHTKKELINTLQSHFSKNSRLNNHSLDTYLLEAIEKHSTYYKIDHGVNLRNYEDRVSLRDSVCNYCPTGELGYT
jgi:ankyrin repeat protein